MGILMMISCCRQGQGSEEMRTRETTGSSTISRYKREDAGGMMGLKCMLLLLLLFSRTAIIKPRTPRFVSAFLPPAMPAIILELENDYKAGVIEKCGYVNRPSNVTTSEMCSSGQQLLPPP